MTSVLAYVLAVLLVPVALSLMLFVMAWIEGEPSAPQSRFPHGADEVKAANASPLIMPGTGKQAA